jgi:hypothetical protein
MTRSSDRRGTPIGLYGTETRLRKAVAAALFGMPDLRDGGRAEVCVGGLGASIRCPFRVALPMRRV